MVHTEAGDNGNTEELPTRRPTGMTQFAHTIWAWQATGEASPPP